MSNHSTSKFRVRFASGPKRSACKEIPTTKSSFQFDSSDEFSFLHTQEGSKGSRSRYGCRGCRARRVKCDETFPVCLRCQRRGEFCESPSRQRSWQSEMPWLMDSVRSLERIEPSQKTDDKLLRYWVESASYIMALDPENNPMSFPILKYFDRSPSLIHALQSIGAAHRYFFDHKKLHRCMEERTLAIQHVRKELDTPTKDPSLAFLTVFVLGLSSYWLALPADDPVSLHHAQAHLQGGRALIDSMLVLSSSGFSQQMYFAFGAYLYWEMACSFVIEPDQQLSIDSPRFTSAVHELSQSYHPIIGYSAMITHLLAKVGRYCRIIEDTGARDFELEECFEDQLKSISPTTISHELGLLEEAYRCHGLINLYAICKRRTAGSATQETIECETVQEHLCADMLGWESLSTWESNVTDHTVTEGAFETDWMFETEISGINGNFDEECFGAINDTAPEDSLAWLDYLPLDDASPSMDLPVESASGNHTDELTCTDPPSRILDNDLNETIRDLAVQGVNALTQIPETHSSINLHGIPLLTAGSELSASDTRERELVSKRFRALYSFNHLPANLTALELLEEIWARRDAGQVTSWLAVMREKGWHLMLG